MSTYYMRDGILYTAKTCCNLVETWQHETRVYPDEPRRRKEQGIREFRSILGDLEQFRKSVGP